MSDSVHSSISDGLPELSESMHLVRRAQGGDRASLDRLLDRYQDRIQRIVRIRLGSHLRNHLETVDIVQEAYQVAWRKLETFEPRGPGSILHWLSKIAENKIHDARDYLYAQKRDRNREGPLDAFSSSTTDVRDRFEADSTLPDDKVAKAEIKEIVDDALGELSTDHREAILLRDYCACEWDEVATALERSPHAAQELHRRAWEKLRRIVRPKLGAVL